MSRQNFEQSFEYSMVEWFINTSRRFCRDCIEKLIHPVFHPQHPPEYTARAVGVGLFVAFTPFFGVHIAIVLALWAITRAVGGNLSFNPVLASAWTLISNVFTIAPLYYIFIQTGQFMSGQWKQIQSFETYLPEFEKTSYTEFSWIEVMSTKAVALFAQFGVPLFLGCLPWALCIGLTGYCVSLYFIRRHRASVAE
ncbi:MAG: DUF2062 domain-containing protein [Alphaproteobacteria bacterium]|nr:DUF2062 domain-containing protein [Alphaproteobacteria bacterium]